MRWYIIHDSSSAGVLGDHDLLVTNYEDVCVVSGDQGTPSCEYHPGSQLSSTYHLRTAGVTFSGGLMVTMWSTGSILNVVCLEVIMRWLGSL